MFQKAGVGQFLKQPCGGRARQPGFRSNPRWGLRTSPAGGDHQQNSKGIIHRGGHRQTSRSVIGIRVTGAVVPVSKKVRSEFWMISPGTESMAV